jgi:hypothetical protein
MILLALACLTNTEPRFQTVNDIEVKHLLGFSFFAPGDYLWASAGVPMDIDIQVRDRERDDVQLLFSRAPPGLDFDASMTRGTWTPPLDYWETFSEISVVAVDEHDAMAWLAIPVFVSGLNYDTGDKGLFEKGQRMAAEVTVGPQTYSGLHTAAWLSEDSTYCEWSWPTSAWVAHPDLECSDCDQVWGAELRQGIAIEGDCGPAPLAQEQLPLSLGFNSQTQRIYQLINSVWTPIGSGTLEDNVLTWDGQMAL